MAVTSQYYVDQVNNGGMSAEDLYSLINGSNADIANAAKGAWTQIVNGNVQTAVQNAFPGASQTQINQIIQQAQGSVSAGATPTPSQLAQYTNNISLNPGSISSTAAQLFANQQQQANQNQLANAIAPGSALYNSYYGNNTPTSAGGIIGTQEAAAQGALQPSLTQANQTLSDTLAARGLSQSGALAGGQAENNQNYATALNNAFASIQGQGAQNLENQAAGTTVNPNYQAVTNSMNQQLQDENSKNAASQNTNGWSWLIPVASAIGTLGGPVGTAIGGTVGGLISGIAGTNNNGASGQPTYNAPSQYYNQQPNNSNVQMANAVNYGVVQ